MAHLGARFSNSPNCKKPTLERGSKRTLRVVALTLPALMTNNNFTDMGVKNAVDLGVEGSMIAEMKYMRRFGNSLRNAWNRRFRPRQKPVHLGEANQAPAEISTAGCCPIFPDLRKLFQKRIRNLVSVEEPETADRRLLYALVTNPGHYDKLAALADRNPGLLSTEAGQRTLVVGIKKGHFHAVASVLSAFPEMEKIVNEELRLTSISTILKRFKVDIYNMNDIQIILENLHKKTSFTDKMGATEVLATMKDCEGFRDLNNFLIGLEIERRKMQPSMYVT